MGTRPDPESDSHNDEDRDDLLAGDEDTRDLARYARRALAILVAHVLAQRDGVLVPITYLNLAERLDRRNRHGHPPTVEVVLAL